MKNRFYKTAAALALALAVLVGVGRLKPFTPTAVRAAAVPGAAQVLAPLPEGQPEYFVTHNTGAAPAFVALSYDGETVRSTGSLPQNGSSGAVLHDRLDLSKPIEFDFEALVDVSGYAASGAQANSPNRFTAITLNEYPRTESGYDLTKNTQYWGQPGGQHNPSEPRGIQFDITCLSKADADAGIGPFILPYAQGGIGSRLCVNTGADYPWLASAFYGRPIDGREASGKIHGVIERTESHYVFSMRAYNAATGSLVGGVYSIRVPRNRVTPEGDFSDAPMLGYVVSNSMAAPLPMANVRSSIGSLRNGNIKYHRTDAAEIRDLKPGNGVKINSTLIPYPGREIEDGDRVFTYASDDPAVAVDADGVVTTTAAGGDAFVTVRSGGGSTARVAVTVFDETRPVVGVDGAFAFPGTAVQFREVLLPKAAASDTGGTVYTRLDIVSPEATEIRPVSGADGGILYYAFTPIMSGHYTIRYTAWDKAGNSAYIDKTLFVTESAKSPDWEHFNGAGGYTAAAFDDGYARMFGTVGSVDRSFSQAKSILAYKHPLNFTKTGNKDPLTGADEYTTVEFELRSNGLDNGKLYNAWGTSTSAATRFLQIGLTESTYVPGVAVNDNEISNNKGGADSPRGIQLRFVRRSDENDEITEGNAHHMNYVALSSGGGISSREAQSIDTIYKPGDSGYAADSLRARNNRYDEDTNNWAKGKTAFYEWQDGGMVELARKLNLGRRYAADGSEGWIKFKYSYHPLGVIDYHPLGEYDPDGVADRRALYILEADGVRFKFPAETVVRKDNKLSDFTQQAYLFICQHSADGSIETDVEVRNVKNGPVVRAALDQGESGVYKVGDSFTLNPNFELNGVSPAYTFTTDNPEVAEVSADGRVTVKKIGYALIGVKEDAAGKIAYHQVRAYPDFIYFGRRIYTVEKGKEFYLECLSPEGAVTDAVYRSTDTEVCGALTTGWIQGAQVGVVTVTATMGGMTAACTVVVTEPPASASFSSAPDGLKGWHIALICAGGGLVAAGAALAAALLVRKKRKGA
ncbi:MAG: FHA domain-containing protein [Clostridiales bacterium]|jgi:hypothetical protein|nr:FHA domain-containing protein [Clostridiales bacterium]